MRNRDPATDISSAGNTLWSSYMWILNISLSKAMMAADMQLLSSAIIPAKNLMRLFTLDTVVAHETPERH
jgi:LPS O-antigen subunit length determinant protein (WzzB/FepE family)